jgi:hypothetical protein
MEVSIGTSTKDNGKVYIKDVHRMSWETGEMCEFASSLVSALSCLGDNIPYDYVMGTSGVAFRFTLNPGEWDFGNYSIRNIAPDEFAPIRRAFAAAGYALTLHEPGTFQDDAAKIMDSIDRGVPVLAYPVVGPSDCCIITGYDQGGDVLLGWSTYQDIPDGHNIPHDVTGYFRKPDWHDHITGYIVIGTKVGRLPLRTVYIDAMKWAVYLLRKQEMEHKVTGLKGLQSWAEEMTQAKYFPAGNAAVIGHRYVSTAINMTMLRDHCLAEPFLRRAAEDVPDFQPELLRAAECYDDVKRIRDGMDELIGDNFSEQAMKAIADPEIRRAYADTILRIREVEAEAVNQIELLLKRCGEN